MRAVASIALALLVAPSSALAEDWGLKSDRLGMSLEAFKAEHRREAARGQFAPMCSDTSPKGAGIAVDGAPLGRVNCSLDFPFERRALPGQQSYVAPLSIAGITSQGHAYRFLDGKLWRIEVLVQEKDFPSLRVSTEAKYGPPSKVANEEVKTRAGVTASSAVLLWEDGEQVIELRQRSGQIDVSGFTVYRKDALAEVERRLKKLAGKAASDM